MPRRPSRHPTELELEILKVLWRLGEGSARQVRDEISAWRNLAYTSVVTVMNIMAKKGYLRRRRPRPKGKGAPFVYRPAVSQEAARGGMLADLVERVFSGSRLSVVQQLLETSDLDPAELRELKQLIRRKEKEQRP
jgi:predicted transcriptional regulator